jgi:hypothetical protein
MLHVHNSSYSVYHYNLADVVWRLQHSTKANVCMLDYFHFFEYNYIIAVNEINLSRVFFLSISILSQLISLFFLVKNIQIT